MRQLQRFHHRRELVIQLACRPTPMLSLIHERQQRLRDWRPLDDGLVLFLHRQLRVLLKLLSPVPSGLIDRARGGALVR